MKEIAQEVLRLQEAAKHNYTESVYEFCRSVLDLTTLAVTDSEESVRALARKAIEMASHREREGGGHVASICVYPSFVETVGVVIDGTDMRITSVVGGFPASQTFLEVKVLETAMAIEHGADEVDVVMNVGKFLDGRYDEVRAELEVLRAETTGVVLKVILETGVLKSPEQIRLAAMIAMESGADFIKTSTGKVDTNTTPEAAVVMCLAIREYHEKTGRKVGFKAAGGIRTPEDAALYYTIVQEILGSEWLTPQLFRIGASRVL